MTELALRPCPKCGGEGKLTSVNRGRWKAVRCLNPDCGFQTKGCKTYEDARTMWDNEPLAINPCKKCGVLPEWHRYENYKAEVCYLQCPKCGKHTKSYYAADFAIESWHMGNFDVD